MALQSRKGYNMNRKILASSGGFKEVKAWAASPLSSGQSKRNPDWLSHLPSGR